MWETVDFFYFNDDDKLGLYYILKSIYPIIKKNHQFFSFNATKKIKKADANYLCDSIFLKNTWWYLRVIGKRHNDEGLIYIFRDKVENGTEIIFNKNTVSVLV